MSITADDIRAFVIREYVDPAGRRGALTFSVRAGDVRSAMGLDNNSMPRICSALGTDMFLNSPTLNGFR